MKTPISIIIAIIFFVNVVSPILVKADMIRLPTPGTMVSLSPAFDPIALKGIKVYPENPLKFEFVLSPGDSTSAVPSAKAGTLKDESTKLIKYFLAALTTPEKDIWVNLSPYEKDRIVPDSFGQTQMGRDLLAQDYLLKQVSASLIYPEGDIGKLFWKRVYEESARKYGGKLLNTPISTFNKVWIVPDKAVVYENVKNGTAYLVESSLKVLTDQDYTAYKQQGLAPEANNNQILNEIVIPEITREINEGKNFAQLRQVYHAIILANWYKKKIKDSILVHVYSDQNKVNGLQYKDSISAQSIYQQYVTAFKKGSYNYIKDEIDPMTQKIVPRKYFSGGANFTAFSSQIKIINQENTSKAMLAPFVELVNATVGFFTAAVFLMNGKGTVVIHKPVNVSEILKDKIKNSNDIYNMVESRKQSGQEVFVTYNIQDNMLLFNQTITTDDIDEYNFYYDNPQESWARLLLDSIIEVIGNALEGRDLENKKKLNVSINAHINEQDQFIIEVIDDGDGILEGAVKVRKDNEPHGLGIFRIKRHLEKALGGTVEIITNRKEDVGRKNSGTTVRMILPAHTKEFSFSRMTNLFSLNRWPVEQGSHHRQVKKGQIIPGLKLDGLPMFQDSDFNDSAMAGDKGRELKIENRIQLTWHDFVLGGIQENPAWMSDDNYFDKRFGKSSILKAGEMVGMVKEIITDALQFNVQEGGVGLVLGFGDSHIGDVEIDEIYKSFKLSKIHGVDWVGSRVKGAAENIMQIGYTPDQIVLHHADARDLSHRIPANSINFIYGVSMDIINDFTIDDKVAQQWLDFLQPGGVIYVQGKLTYEGRKILSQQGELLNKDGSFGSILVYKKYLNKVDSAQLDNTGGIDFSAKGGSASGGNAQLLNLQINNAGIGIQFKMDPAMLQELQNSSGLTPFIVSIQPMTDIKQFLGL